MTQTLISLLTLPLKLEHIHHMNPAWKIQANEKTTRKTYSSILPQAGTYTLLGINSHYKPTKFGPNGQG